MTTSADDRTVLLGEGAVVGGPAHDAALGQVLLRHGSTRQVIRVYTPAPTAGFSRRDSLRPGIGAALRAARERGFEPVLRGPGGRLAVYHRGSVVVDHVGLEPGATAGMGVRFEHYAAMHAGILRELGLDARVGEVPGEYCPGTYSVNAGGVSKIVGSAQRLNRRGWLFSTVIQVAGSAELRDLLVQAYDCLGYDLDPATVGAVEDFVPGVTVTQVAQAVNAAYSALADEVSVELPEEIVTALAEAVRERAGELSGDD
jgi:octanoyl-[GcvH]:protein N-octanoyltransferase